MRWCCRFAGLLRDSGAQDELPSSLCRTFGPALLKFCIFQLLNDNLPTQVAQPQSQQTSGNPTNNVSGRAAGGGGGTGTSTASGASGGASGSAANSFFGSFGKKFYEGGFDDKMSRREAALILGVRESATQQRIKVRKSSPGCTCTRAGKHRQFCLFTCSLQQRRIRREAIIDLSA